MASKARKNELKKKYIFEGLLASYWQKIVDELVQNISKAYPFSQGGTAAAIGENKGNLIEITAQGYLVTITMPDYYQFLDEGVSGAIKNKNISRFKYKDGGKGRGGKGQRGVPNLGAIRRFMLNRGINTFEDIKSKRGFKGRNTKSGKKRDAEEIRQNVAYVIAYSIWKNGQEPTNFYSSVINDNEIIEFERKILAQYRKYILAMVDI